MKQDAVIVWAYGETNSYPYANRDMVGIFTSEEEMLKALKRAGMTRAQLKDYRHQNPYHKFPFGGMNIDYFEGRDNDAFSFEDVTINTNLITI